MDLLVKKYGRSQELSNFKGSIKHYLDNHYSIYLRLSMSDILKFINANEEFKKKALSHLDYKCQYKHFENFDSHFQLLLENNILASIKYFSVDINCFPLGEDKANTKSKMIEWLDVNLFDKWLKENFYEFYGEKEEDEVETTFE